MRYESRHNSKQSDQRCRIPSLQSEQDGKPAEEFDAWPDHAEDACERYSLTSEARSKCAYIQELAKAALDEDERHEDTAEEE